MDNQKIGKLIAQLRNRHGLTQQDLGDKIGVGFRAVSKWERGINLPDIANMTELSKIFGISLDELMAGELKEKEELKSTKKISSKMKILISVITIAIIILIAIVIYHNTKTYVYGIKSISDEYYIEGQVIFEGEKINIIVNYLEFLDENILNTQIKYYEYEITSNNLFLFGYGQTPNGEIIDETIPIKEMAADFQINYVDKTQIKRTKMLQENATLTFKFKKDNNEEIVREIEFKLFPYNTKDAE